MPSIRFTEDDLNFWKFYAEFLENPLQPYPAKWSERLIRAVMDETEWEDELDAIASERRANGETEEPL